MPKEPRRRVWKVTAADIASAAGLTTRQLRSRINAREVDPADLTSLVDFLAKESGRDLKLLVRAVRETGGDMTKLAAVLGISRATLYRRAKET